MDPIKAESALRALIDAVNSAGGCEVDRKGYVVPRADDEWVDLGAAYVAACGALDVEPMVSDSTNEL